MAPNELIKFSSGIWRRVEAPGRWHSNSNVQLLPIAPEIVNTPLCKARHQILHPLLMLHSILLRLNISKTKLQPFFARSRFLRHLYTRTELEGELCDIREGLQTLRVLVDHPKAVNFLRAVKDYESGDQPESSDEDRWAEVACRLQMPQNHHDTNKLIYDLTDFSPPQLYLPPSFHTETYKTGWKYLESSRANSSDSVVPGEQVLFHVAISWFEIFPLSDTSVNFKGLALASSLFHNHVKIVSNEPIPKSCQLPDPLPSGEPVSYQVG